MVFYGEARGGEAPHAADLMQVAVGARMAGKGGWLFAKELVFGWMFKGNIYWNRARIINLMYILHIYIYIV